MITAFTVKNFKAIGEEPVRIEFKPITLLFGPNSAGKSSIIHALHYAHEIFISHNLNPQRSTIDDHSFIDLGGFERFVYNRDLNRIIFIRIDSDNYHDIKSIPESLFIRDLLFKQSFNFDGIINFYVEIDIAWNQINNKPYVKRYETGLNDERMATINFDVQKKQAVLEYLNIDHPLFHEVWVDKSINFGSLIKNTFDQSFYKISSDINQESVKVNEIVKKERKIAKDKIGNDLVSGEKNLNIVLRQEDALPADWNQPLRIDSTWKESTENELIENRFLLNDLLTYVIIIPGNDINSLLLNRYHLGPLREIPPRYFSGIDPYHESNRWRWEKGLAAWDLLYWIGQKQLEAKSYSIDFSSPLMKISNRQDIDIFNISSAFDQLDNINSWLANKNRLNSGYKVIIQHYREVPSTHPLLEVVNQDNPLENISDLVKDIIQIPEKTRIWLQDDSQNLLTLHEIGIGISQILPVVVAATGKPWGLSLLIIEQPELHIHPAMQVQLADLFISQAIEKKGMRMKEMLSMRYFLIETHSEHLLLRLLRRINETYEDRLSPDSNPCTADDVAIYYLEKKSQGLKVRRLEISEDGDSKGEWPEGFFEERRAELF